MSGHIEKRGKNSWRLRFEVGVDPLTRKRRTRLQTFRGTHREAKIKLAQLITEYERGEYVDQSKMTVAEFIDRWQRDYAKTHVSAKTYERYAELLRNHVTPLVGQLQLQKLRAIDINELYGILIKGREGWRPLAPRTVGHVHRVLHRALGHAQKWSLVAQNVASLVSPPRVAFSEIELLEPAQAQTLLESLQGHRLHSIVMLALATGMRRGELLALRWNNVDLDGGVLRVEQSLEQTKAGGLVFKAPKTKHGRRSITLPATAVATLRDHWKTQQELRLKLGMGKAPADALVFSTYDDQPRKPNALTKEFSSAVKAAKLPPASLHSLRHTHASQLIASGHDVLSISRRLGHGSAMITLTVYGHLFPSTDDRAAKSIDAMLTGKPG